MNIEPILDAYLKKTKQPHGGDQKIHPSGFGRCWRFQLWSRQGKAQDELEPRKARVFKVGNMIEDLIVSALKTQEGINFQVPVVGIQGYEDVAGAADIATTDTVIDVKSQHSKGFWWMQKPNYDVKKEKRGNWLQVSTYGLLLGKDKVSLLFVSKDDLCIKQYWDQTCNWEKDVKEEISQNRTNWLNQDAEAAPRAFAKECRFCCFSNQCEVAKCQGNVTE